ncbi:MAG: hypothetical protein KC776_33460 [Myxococcales bacterium]|nr:hypothetical protein [Myxococcales bacterium]MCB9582791.1 hypothetical protein [Polyangiaceae bacterium]
METLVLLEATTRLPSWVDHEAGPESNVMVLAERPGDHPVELESRALAYAGQVSRTILVCGPEGGRERTAVRSALILELSERGPVLLATSAEVTPELAEVARLYRVQLRLDMSRGREETFADPVRRVA